ncbi:MAG: arsenate reductase family protein [Oscillospiraceae bacterium]
MNIQIFGKSKCFDTKKAERYFKERGIKYQYIDILSKGMGRGELESVVRALGGIDRIIDENSRDYAEIKATPHNYCRSIAPQIFSLVQHITFHMTQKQMFCTKLAVCTKAAQAG